MIEESDQPKQTLCDVCQEQPATIYLCHGHSGETRNLCQSCHDRNASPAEQEGMRNALDRFRQARCQYCGAPAAGGSICGGVPGFSDEKSQFWCERCRLDLIEFSKLPENTLPEAFDISDVEFLEAFNRQMEKRKQREWDYMTQKIVERRGGEEKTGPGETEGNSNTVLFLRTLRSLLPAWKGASLFFVDADSVLKAISSLGIPVKMIPMVEPGQDWDLVSSDFSDEEILKRMFGEKLEKLPNGKLLIVTEACTRFSMEPWLVSHEHFRDFVIHYDIEMFFDGDVVILAPDAHQIVVFHHEGYFAHFDLRNG